MKLLDSNIIIAEAARINQQDLPLATIAATALKYALPLVTRNLQYFRHIRELELLPA